MNRPLTIIVASLIVGAGLIACGWFIHAGLTGVAKEIREKPISSLPADIRLGVGNPDIKITFGQIKMDGKDVGSRGSGASGSGDLTIDNIKIEIPASQPARGGG